MTARVVIADNRRWRFAPDEPPVVAERTQAMLQARLIDEILGTPPAGPVHARTRVRGAVARFSPGGRIGVIGRPALAFFAPSIALARMDLTIDAPGFLPLHLDSAVGAQPGYPQAFAPVDLGNVPLHRLPVRISGRVVSRALGPLVGATITVQGYWPLLAHPPGPVVAPNLMPALAGLYADRPVGGSLRRRNLTPAAPFKSLARPAAQGDSAIRLSDRQAIAAGQILAMDFDDVERAEFVGIAAVDMGSSADQPAEVTLDLPLRREHAEDASVARAVPAAGGAANAIIRPARVGDISLFTAGLAGLGAATSHIEITGGGAPAEYHASSLYRATSDANGTYGLPPVHRIAAIELRVTHPAIAVPASRIVTPAWAAAEQREDFVVP